MYLSTNDLMRKYQISRSNVARATRLIRDGVEHGLLHKNAYKRIGASIRFDEKTFLEVKENEKEMRRTLSK